MYRLKILLTARTECNHHGLKNVVWEELPFIQKMAEECKILQEEMPFKEKKANRIFQQIVSMQSEYQNILMNADETIKEINCEIQRKHTQMTAIDQELKLINDQITSFHNGQMITPISQLRETSEILSRERMSLETEAEELDKQINETRKTTQKQLDIQYETLKKEYEKFSERLRITKSKISQSVAKRKKYVSIYADYFWKYYIKKYNRYQKSTGKKNAISLSCKPEVKMEQFKINEIFTKEKEIINNFNQKHNRDYIIL